MRTRNATTDALNISNGIPFDISAENTWGFGQLLAVILLVLPMFAMTEAFVG
jgi:hypothetical protein